MAVGSTLRYEQVPLEDFLACLIRHEQDVRLGFLPPAGNLKELRIESLYGPPSSESSFRFTLYLLQETEALSQQLEVFLLLHAPGAMAQVLRGVSVRLREFLDGRQIASLFRIDPRYGMVCGSKLEPVDPSVKWDRPGAYVALYLTGDPGAPSLSLIEYVPQGMRRRYQELFLKYNGVMPVAPGLIRTAWKRLVGTAPQVRSEQRPLTYRQVRHLAAFLSEERVESPVISLIYKDLSRQAGEKALLDPHAATFCESGNDRFFASLGELA